MPPSSHYKPIGCKWVYKLKLKSDRSIDRYKAWFVAKGYNQTVGINYFETFSSLVKPTAIMIVLNIVVSKNWPI